MALRHTHDIDPASAHAHGQTHSHPAPEGNGVDAAASAPCCAPASPGCASGIATASPSAPAHAAATSCCAPVDGAAKPALPGPLVLAPCCGGATDEATAADDVGIASPAAARHVFRIPTMDCSVEESEIRRLVEPMPGVKGLHFALSRRQLRIDADDAAVPAALAAIRKAGYAPEPVAVATTTGPAGGGATAGHAHGGHDAPRDDAHDHAHGAGSGGLVRLGAALGLALVAEGVAWFAPDATAWTVAGMAIAALAIGLAGLETYGKGLTALRRGRLNINALMSVAVTGAFVIGQWPEAAMVMALYAIAELIEARAVDRARNAIQGLVDLAPAEADVRQDDGAWRRVPTAGVAPGAVARVRPGERVAFDGVVTRGEGSIDQASVTGESIPVDKAPGDPVFAGTVNQNGELEFRVTAASGDSTLARIIHAVEEAQGTRAPTQRFVDRFAAIYTPAVFALALAVAVLPPLLLGWGWLAALYKALVLLVIACPCALVISTPVTVVSGLAAAARRGILIKGGTYLEEARLLKAVDAVGADEA